jgi:enoyl-CoA hydratase
MAQRVLGYQRAAALTLFGEVVDAQEAVRIGLAHRVAQDVRAAAVEMAARAGGLPRDLVVTTKATMRLTAAMATQEQAVEVEVRAQAQSVRSEEFQQRLAALQASIRSR